MPVNAVFARKRSRANVGVVNTDVSEGHTGLPLVRIERIDIGEIGCQLL
jgi:hypothetical protein